MQNFLSTLSNYQYSKYKWIKIQLTVLRLLTFSSRDEGTPWTLWSASASAPLQSGGHSNLPILERHFPNFFNCLPSVSAISMSFFSLSWQISSAITLQIYQTQVKVINYSCPSNNINIIKLNNKASDRGELPLPLYELLFRDLFSIGRGGPRKNLERWLDRTCTTWTYWGHVGRFGGRGLE